jgi:hypothetical protein
MGDGSVEAGATRRKWRGLLTTASLARCAFAATLLRACFDAFVALRLLIREPLIFETRAAQHLVEFKVPRKIAASYFPARGLALPLVACVRLKIGTIC